VSARELNCLCVNAGSSSLKLALYRVGPDGREHRLRAGSAREIGSDHSSLDIAGRSESFHLADHRAALEVLSEGLQITQVDAVGHRVVHGGEHHRPERVTPGLLERLDALRPLAPLHLPPALACIAAIAERWPQLPQFACFDTAFHASLPEQARTLPLPGYLRDSGLRRYGFHGLSCEYVVRRLGARARGRVVIAHLGNGASLTALRDGRSVDTTMGFTPSGGVMMGTRSGDLDPGVLLYLLREKGYDAPRLAHLLDRESGLLGVSGTSADVETLLGRSGDPDARLALDLFAYQVRKAVGALAAVLGGLDRLVFTGGIGEHAAPVREAICEDLGHLGIELDPQANEAHGPVISDAGAACCVEIVPTDEDAMIALHALELFGHSRS